MLDIHERLPNSERDQHFTRLPSPLQAYAGKAIHTTNGYTKILQAAPIVLTYFWFAVIIIDVKSIGLASLTAPIQAIGAVVF